MTRTTTFLFLTLALVVVLGCCNGKPCAVDGADAGKTTTPVHD